MSESLSANDGRVCEVKQNDVANETDCESATVYGAERQPRKKN